ncbi:HNH endonuclease signature motif containing protein [Brevibacterium pigmentatum]|uniref:HNH endonuclease signature motif containing protein n=1 Tax=Brevibacterium pigmentatum TaxID=1496080 RepID=UPI001421FC49
MITTPKWIVNAETGCWEWILYLDRSGYGRLTFAGKRGYYAHRWSYEQHVGEIPDDMTVDHLCFNPACVNPGHLRLLSLPDNSANQRSAIKTHCKNGHEYTPENTYIRPARKHGGQRDCRTCIRERVARYASRKAAA